MKFGSQLRAALHSEWAEYYVDYDGLKKLLKEGEKKEGGYTDKDESRFVEMLDRELEKIYAFQNTKYEEIKNRVRQCESSVESIGKDPSLNVPERYADIERQINSITEEVNELAKYARLNYTGIVKIVKKHDRRTSYNLRPMFSVRLNACPFYKETFEPVIVNLSQLYHIVHKGLGETEVPRDLPSSWKSSTIIPSQERIARRSNKYWVHYDNIMEVKTTILRHLPVLLYKSGSDSSVHSIYFDNEVFELYQDKVDRKPGDQVIRLRWYGNKMSTNEIFVERKIREDGEDEIKDRFLVKEKYISGFLKGEYSMDKIIKKMKETPGKTEEDILNFQKVVKDIQHTINDKKLQPVLHTYYNRMAFQIPGDSRVRISLDTEFYIIREDNFDNTNRRRDDHWRRMDIDDDNFSKLQSSECVKFPYAVLEVKHNLGEGEQEPDWVKELVGSYLVEEAPQFSKYVHGVATLFTSKAPSLPYWLPNIDKDILKPPSTRQPDENDEPASSSSILITPGRPRRVISGKNAVDVGITGDPKDRKNKGKAVVYNADEDEEQADESAPLLGEEVDEAPSHQPIGLTTFNRIFRKRRTTDPFILNYKTPFKVGGPIRVEPKVYFANERTFFSWMRFSVLLGTLSLGLFNAATVENKLAMFCGVMYAFISVGVLLYSLFQYKKRNRMINNRYPGPYDDLFGPTFVCFAIFAAIGLNFYLKFAPRMIEGGGETTNDIINDTVLLAIQV